MRGHFWPFSSFGLVELTIGFLGPLLSTSAVRQSEVRQRVVGMLGRAAAAEFDVPGERRRSSTLVSSVAVATSPNPENT